MERTLAFVVCDLSNRVAGERPHGSVCTPYSFVFFFFDLFYLKYAHLQAVWLQSHAALFCCS